MNWKDFEDEVDEMINESGCDPEELSIVYIDWSNGYEINREDVCLIIDPDKKEIKIF